MSKAHFSFLGRQPIFNSKGETNAYSILFRQDNSRAVTITDSREVYARNLDTMVHSIGINNVLDDKKGWIKIDDQTIIKSDLTLLPKDRIVFELTNTSNFSVKVSTIIEELINEGYSFALPETLIDDVLQKRDEAFFALFEYVVFNVRKMNFENFHRHESLFKKSGSRLLATQVETLQGYELCERMKFDLFIGYFFEQPTILKGKHLSTNIATFMRLLAMLKNNEDIDDIINVIRSAPDVSLLLLKYINAAGISTKKEIHTIDQAVALLGQAKLLSWVVVMLLTSTKGVFNQMLFDSSLMRAKLMEELAKALKRDRLLKEAYLVGLLSLSDAIFNVSMATIVDDAAFDETISKALLEGEGELGKILKIVLIIEKGNFRKIELISQKLNIPLETFTEMLKNAFSYIQETKKFRS